MTVKEIFQKITDYNRIGTGFTVSINDILKYSKFNNDIISTSSKIKKSKGTKYLIIVEPQNDNFLNYINENYEKNKEKLKITIDKIYDGIIQNDLTNIIILTTSYPYHHILFPNSWKNGMIGNNYVSPNTQITITDIDNKIYSPTLSSINQIDFLKESFDKNYNFITKPHKLLIGSKGSSIEDNLMNVILYFQECKKTIVQIIQRTLSPFAIPKGIYSSVIQNSDKNIFQLNFDSNWLKNIKDANSIEVISFNDDIENIVKDIYDFYNNSDTIKSKISFLNNDNIFTNELEEYDPFKKIIEHELIEEDL